jgi:hypothetical protein
MCIYMYANYGYGIWHMAYGIQSVLYVVCGMWYLEDVTGSEGSGSQVSGVLCNSSVLVVYMVCIVYY